MFKKQRNWRRLSLVVFIVMGLFLQSVQKKHKSTIRIGIIQFVEHDALDCARKGFIDGLSSFKNIEIAYKNAQGDQANCTLIANLFAAGNYDLVLAIATPAAQATAAIVSETPILVTAITNPEDAGVVKSNLKPEANVTGTSDLPPIHKQIELAKKLVPEAKNIGILYSLGEANSRYQADIAVKEAQRLDLKPQVFTFSQMAEIQQVVESMIGKVEVIYTPTDNAVASNMPLIAKTALLGGIPVICGEGNLIEKGATGTCGMSYYELGKLTAIQAAKILEGKARPESMPIEYLSDTELTLNGKIIEKLGIIIPQELAKNAKFI
ncbi:MAG: ABC transporter substrate-binding protein [Oscillospiraceae bacterium]|nr:ABC transporter substrate-binding protein [Oscillospiraceae bacterium]